MSAGTELSCGVFQLGPGQQQAIFELINTSSYISATAPPAALPPNGGAQFQSARRSGPVRLAGSSRYAGD
jgi:hypothetical protein